MSVSDTYEHIFTIPMTLEFMVYSDILTPQLHPWGAPVISMLFPNCLVSQSQTHICCKVHGSYFWTKNPHEGVHSNNTLSTSVPGTVSLFYSLSPQVDNMSHCLDTLQHKNFQAICSCYVCLVTYMYCCVYLSIPCNICSRRPLYTLQRCLFTFLW